LNRIASRKRTVNQRLKNVGLNRIASKKQTVSLTVGLERFCGREDDSREERLILGKWFVVLSTELCRVFIYGVFGILCSILSWMLRRSMASAVNLPFYFTVLYSLMSTCYVKHRLPLPICHLV
jgi:hypothetical protein